MKQLEEIKARASAAAVGPWRWDEGFGDELDTGTALTNDIGTEIIGAYNHHCCSYRDEPTVDENSAPFIAAARSDVPKLVAALESVVAWCDLLQYPTTDYPEGFSSQDYALDDAARRVRAAITEALEAA